MVKIKSIKDLQIRSRQIVDMLHVHPAAEKKITVAVGMATCGIASGAREIFAALNDETLKLGLKNIELTQYGCIGHCYAEPIVEVRILGQETIRYGRVDEDKAREIVRCHLRSGEPFEEAIIGRILESDGDIHLDQKQMRIVLRNCGLIDPESIDNYIGVEGYKALGKVLTDMSPAEVIEVMKDSGLRGRGGADSQQV